MKISGRTLRLTNKKRQPTNLEILNSSNHFNLFLRLKNLTLRRFSEEPGPGVC